MNNLSQSQEDYLETIYTESQKKGSAKVTDIANILNVKKASVTGALNVLCEKKLINYAPYSTITLTPLGEETAKRILLRHEVMTNFLINILDMSKEEAAQNACRLEHVMSEQMFSRIHSFSHFIQDYSLQNKDFKNQMQNLFK